MKRLNAVMITALALAMFGCNANPNWPKLSPLERVTHGLVITEATVRNLQGAVIRGNQTVDPVTGQRVISDEVAIKILDACVEISKAGKAATELTKNLALLNEQSSTQVLQIIQPLIKFVDNLTNTGLVGIKNLQTKQEIQLILLSLQSTLSIIQVTITSSGGA